MRQRLRPRYLGIENQANRMARVFLDVGGYEGESVHAALDPRFGFDRVYCFEPVRALSEEIGRIRDARLHVIQAGLFDSDCRREVFHAGTLAGSAFQDAPAFLEEGHREECEFLDASRFFAEHIKKGDVVYMKLNCEGSECAILENLSASGEVRKLAGMLVDFDARKIPSQASRVDAVVRTMHALGVRYFTPEQVQHGMINNYGGIRNWLVVAGAGVKGPLVTLRSAAYQSRIMLTRNHNGYYKMLLLKRFPLLRKLRDGFRRVWP
jgi:FkbM family methyltransferase